MAINFFTLRFNNIDKYYICSFGEVTKHFHFHLFPRYKWMLKTDNIYVGDLIDGAKLFSKIRRESMVGISEDNVNKIKTVKLAFDEYLSKNFIV